jgi:hypothetical protein
MGNIHNIYTVLFICFISFSSCSTADLDPSLEQEKSVEDSIESASDLESLIKGAYNELTAAGYYGRDFIINGEIRSDNCFANGNSGRFITPAAFSYNANTEFIFDNAYQAIAIANIIIAVDLSTLIGDAAYGAHIQGQAYAIRALAHFDLVKQYGQQHAGGTLGIPYTTIFKGTDLFPSRNTVEENKTAIYQDLESAYTHMSASYFDNTKEFMSQMTAKALESRVAVYFKDWIRARDAAKIVIDSGIYSIIPAASYVSSWAGKGNVNSIFELAFSATDNLNNDGLGYIYKTGGNPFGYGDIQVIDGVENMYDSGDVRAGILGYEGALLRNLGKYPNINGYDNVVVIRHEEVVLNYAEALLETSGDALTQLNLITSNRGATAYTTATKTNILDERRKELIFEGFRFDDLVRNDLDISKTATQQNFTMTIPYGDPKLAWPIPQKEIDANSNMVQNTGY